MPETKGNGNKPKVAFYWCASCGGCEEAVVDLAEGILDVVAAVDIVFWPVALDFKRKDLEEMEDGSIAVSFINGAIRTSEQEEMAHLLRQKSGLVVAFGACAHLGGIPSLANLFSRDEILKFVYSDSPTADNPEGVLPQPTTVVEGGTLTLPHFDQKVRALDQVVSVDYYLPGCPPTPQGIAEAVNAILTGQLPERGSVLAPDVALCDQCERKETRPEKLMLREFHRPYQVAIDEEKCLLAQGILCMGPATRAGCEALCLKGNMPCTGCFGPTSRARDQGGKFWSAVASMIDSTDPEEIEKILDTFVDPIGTGYRYSLAASLLGGRRAAGEETKFCGGGNPKCQELLVR